ncbi:cullin-2 isoform X3 [Hydra vulgaris]|uniref:Cullin-2 isoform X3 n=1 Tax=Hydra vulgaris TaxID=6087 RepID=A0ABM4CWJ2_HYDVU
MSATKHQEFRSTMRPTDVNFNEVWTNICGTLQNVITLTPINRAEWHERFSDIYKICASDIEGLDAKLYLKTKEFFESHSRKIYQNISTEQNLLGSYHRHWLQYEYGTNCINGLYRYLNDHYALRKKGNYAEYVQVPTAYEVDKKPIGALAFEMWKSEIIKPLQDSLISALLQEITKDRMGERPSVAVVKGVIHSFIDVHNYVSTDPEKDGLKLKLYQTAFEQPVLLETSNFYKNESNRILEFCNCSQYMEKVDSRLAEENLRVQRYLHPSTFDKVMNVAQSRLVEDHLELLTGECRRMVKEQKFADLKRMYKLLRPLPKGFKEMLTEFEIHITETGLDRVKSLHTESDTGQFVNVLLDLHVEYTQIIHTTFKKDQSFFGARDKACTKVVNHKLDAKKPCKSPELLAKYCDSLLKKNTKNFPETEIDEKLNNVITIFKYLDEKDIFQKFYSILLAKRLIHNLSVSMDAEEGMITKLKLACGYEYTNKLHRMFTDMAISKELESKFSDFLRGSNTELGINFSVLVLQSGAWPLGQSVSPSVMLPSEFSRSAQMFKTFYNSKFNGRKLTWLQNLSNGEVKLTYLKKPYLVTCTTYQMAVLLLYNDSDSLSYNDIKLSCELEEKELKRTLQSIVDVKIFFKSPEDVEDLCLCSFSLNLRFANKRTKFKITAALQKETPQIIEQTHVAVDEDRKMYTQAAIVRIMKSRQILRHNILIQEVIDQSRAKFSPSTQMIKKSIEALIEKNYIERVSGSRDEYSYVA